MSEAIRSFRELVVWQKAHQLFLQLVRDVEVCDVRLRTASLPGYLVRGAHPTNSAQVADVWFLDL